MRSPDVTVDPRKGDRASESVWKYAPSTAGFPSLPIVVDSTRRKSAISWQKRAVALEHGFEYVSRLCKVDGEAGR